MMHGGVLKKQNKNATKQTKTKPYLSEMDSWEVITRDLHIYFLWFHEPSQL